MEPEISIRKVVNVIFHARKAHRSRELAAFIAALNEDEQAHLVAIAWVGRGAFEAAVPTADYLMGMPHLAENLEAGLEALGYDVTEAEEDFFDR
jgi:hypothetical protein